MVIKIAAMFLVVRCANAECYGANTVSSFSWCSGYEQSGYSCSNGMCASSTCLGQCYFCAVRYPNATLNKETGMCCEGPQCHNATVRDDAYGLPDHHPAMIFEGVRKILHFQMSFYFLRFPQSVTSEIIC